MLLSLGAAGPAAGAIPSRPACAATLPVSVSAPTSNAAALQEIGSLRVRTRDGVRVRNLHAILRRHERTVADGARGRAFSGAASLRLTFRGTLRAGATSVVVSGRQVGCTARRQVRRTLLLDERNLPVRVIETQRDLLDGRLGVTLGVAARTSITGLRARLLDGAGTTIAQVTRRAATTGTANLDFALRGSASGRRWLLVTAGVGGEPARRAFADRIELGSEADRMPGDLAWELAAPPPPGAIVQHAAISWSGGQWQGNEGASFYAPAIGDGEIVCRPDTQWIRVHPADRTRDAAMMLWTFRDWEHSSEYAIRESELTQYTGPDFNEGFNKFHPAEKRSGGSFVGVIGDGLPAAGVFGSGRSPTEVRLSWSWDFTDPASASCSVAATFTSQGAGTIGALATGLSLAWRGADGVPADTTTTTPVPGLGRVHLRCDPRPEGSRQLVVEPDRALAGLDVVGHEGSDTSRRTVANTPYVVPVPNNGLLEIGQSGAGPPLRLVLSSRWKVNDPDPAANFCRLSGIAVAG